MKRTLLVLTTLLFAVMLAAPARAHAEDASVLIHVDTVNILSGEEIDLPVRLADCAGVDSVQFDINYDGAALAFVSMTPGDLFAAQYTVVNADVPGRIRVACASALGLEGAGTIMTLRFRPLTDAGSAVTISSGIVTRVDADYNQSTAYVSIEDGGISISGAALPQPAVTPWIPASPTPTPSPEPTPMPEPEQTIAVPSEPAAPSAPSIPATTLYIAGGLLLLVIVLAAVIFGSRRNKANNK